MVEVAKKERTTLHRRVTKKIRELKSSMQNLFRAELQADIDLLKQYEAELKGLDNKILTEYRNNSDFTEEMLEKLEDECDDLRKTKVCINQTTAISNASTSSDSIVGHSSGFRGLAGLIYQRCSCQNFGEMKRGML